MSKNDFYTYNDKIIEDTVNDLMNENLIDVYQLSRFNFIHIKDDEKLLFFINVKNNKIFYLPIIVKRVKNNNDIFFFETLHGYSGPVSNSTEKFF